MFKLAHNLTSKRHGNYNGKFAFVTERILPIFFVNDNNLSVTIGICGAMVNILMVGCLGDGLWRGAGEFGDSDVAVFLK